MIWTLALMLWQVATPLPSKQYHFRPQAPTRPAVVTPYGQTTLVPNQFVKGESPTGKCSIPLLNAMDFKRPPNTRPVPMPSPTPRSSVDPKMSVKAPAPPCENWFAK